ncbi:hypothetical protein [Catenulispora pinisilvae]|uniref:hypothetical protein n=1 Tax=Catenulispora pinisilvae TaxID=2705253 RepID=UPI0018911E6C|nr:hypothetical protein [Catenulispora pinisilvae]
MPDLAVDLDGIDGFTGSLDRLRAAFDSSATDVTGFADQVGGPGPGVALADALREFGQRWVSGREVLTSYFQALTDMTRASSAKLRAADVDLARKAPGQ